MCRSIMNDNKPHTAAFAGLRNHVIGQASKWLYNLRPEQPIAGLAYIPIAANAKKLCYCADEPINVVVWNTLKGKRTRYYGVLSQETSDADLILLQEFRHDPLLEAAHAELFSQREAMMAASFYTRPQQSSPTGVCTIASAHANKTEFLLSRYFEPVTRTPKVAMCTYYPYGEASCPPEQSLLVLNSHGINFRLRRPFRDQMLQFEDQLRHHQGPIILVGDFNTWEKGRVEILEAVARNIGLSRVRFPPGIKRVQGHELDRVYVRGGDVSEQRVVIDHAASDHSMLLFRFMIR